MTNVVRFPGSCRYPPHVALLDELRASREESKARVQELTDAFRITVWRAERRGNLMLLCDRLLRHPDGGKEWVLGLLADLRADISERVME